MSLKNFLIIALAFAVSGFVAGCSSDGGPLSGDSLGASGGLSSIAINRGRTVEIGRFLHWDKNCWAATIPRVKIIKRPRLGSVSVRGGNHKITRSICKGIPIRGTKLTYRGYRRGTDEFTYRVSSGPRAGVHTVRITVK